MSIQSLILLALQASIFLAVLAVGMRVAPGDLACVLRTPSRRRYHDDVSYTKPERRGARA